MKKFFIYLILIIFYFGCGGTTTKEYSVSEEQNTTVIQSQSAALEYLNSLREKAGMINFGDNNELDEAAENHAYYLTVNNTSGHYEDENNEGFTGVAPSDRALYAGYLSRSILENVSVGQNDYNSSIDDLFSAIYHRLAFLSTDFNIIGIGINGKSYVYDIGNSILNTLCASDSYEGEGSYYINVCADESLKIYVGDYNGALDDIRKQNPDIILWPYKDATGISPVFYNEDPDPLPDYNVSGYPVSIQFNKYYFNEDNITLNSFTLYNENGTEVNNTRLMDENNDPNKEFNAYEFALFPLKRLEWNETYTAEVNYTYNNSSYTLLWQFKTKALPYPYFRIDTSDATEYVDNNKTYAYYFVPADGSDIIKSYSYSYTTGDYVQTGMIDYNTVWIKAEGKSGDEFDFNFDNGDKLKLIIK